MSFGATQATASSEPDAWPRVDHQADVGPVRVDGKAIVVSSVSSSTAPSKGGQRVKRCFDVVLALVLLLLVLPVFVVAAVGVKLSSPGPVFFRQTRIGRHGRAFDILKFRTFPVEHEPPSIEERDGDVVVPVEPTPLGWGNLLRRTSIDELPQLLNVIRGDMSLVGPRPERPDVVAALADVVPGYRDRHVVPVGITGYAQVLGLSGCTPIGDRIAADRAYIADWSFGRDLAILVRTIPALWHKSRT